VVHFTTTYTYTCTVAAPGAIRHEPRNRWGKSGAEEDRYGFGCLARWLAGFVVGNWMGGHCSYEYECAEWGEQRQRARETRGDEKDEEGEEGEEGEEADDDEADDEADGNMELDD